MNGLNLFFNRFDQTPTPPLAQLSLLPHTTSSTLCLPPHLYSISLSTAFMLQDCGLHLLHEPEAGKSATAMENLQCGTSTKDPSPKILQQLQTSCFHFTPDEDPGVAGPRPSPPSGGSFYGPTPFCPSTWHLSGQCHQLHPGQIASHFYTAMLHYLRSVGLPILH